MCFLIMFASAGSAIKLRLLSLVCLVSSPRLEVWRNNFWMMHYGSTTPKRTTVWSTRRVLVASLAPASVTDVGSSSLVRGQRPAEEIGEGETHQGGSHPPLPQLCLAFGFELGSYTKKDGTKGFCGTKALKQTQSTTQFANHFFKSHCAVDLGSTRRGWARRWSGSSRRPRWESDQSHVYARSVLCLSLTCKSSSHFQLETFGRTLGPWIASCTYGTARSFEFLLNGSLA